MYHVIGFCLVALSFISNNKKSVTQHFLIKSASEYFPLASWMTLRSKRIHRIKSGRPRNSTIKSSLPVEAQIWLNKFQILPSENPIFNIRVHLHMHVYGICMNVYCIWIYNEADYFGRVNLSPYI